MVVEPARIRTLLEAELTAILERHHDLHHDLRSVVEAAKDVATDDEHDPEGATIAYERARTAERLEARPVARVCITCASS